MTGIRRGWEGLTHVNLEDPASKTRYILPLNRDNTRTIDRTGGTFLHTTRTNPSKMKSPPGPPQGRGLPQDGSHQEGRHHHGLRPHPAGPQEPRGSGIDYLIAIGGDDTLSYAAKLDKLGVKVIAIPKTMDNDVRNTEYCIGFSTAITRATDAIQRQRTTVGSHERVGIFRVFGRDAGYTALYTAYVTSIRCGIPEHKFDLEKLIDLLLNDKRNNPSNYSIVRPFRGRRVGRLSGARVRRARRFRPPQEDDVGEDLSDEIKKRTKEETVVSDLTYELRSGEPDFVDKMVASTFGNMAMDCLLEDKHRRHDGHRQRLLRTVPDPRSQARPAHGGCRDHVQHRALPAQLRQQGRVCPSS